MVRFFHRQLEPGVIRGVVRITTNLLGDVLENKNEVVRLLMAKLKTRGRSKFGFPPEQTFFCTVELVPKDCQKAQKITVKQTTTTQDYKKCECSLRGALLSDFNHQSCKITTVFLSGHLDASTGSYRAPGDRSQKNALIIPKYTRSQVLRTRLSRRNKKFCTRESFRNGQEKRKPARKTVKWKDDEEKEDNEVERLG
ncbi:hypothetical protein RUM43_007224 [Polyplax serrata]|uniref:Uncharacterized protein n=1 Tax=Polyplax serrata TaxID=468196 RepID=A0AAN8P5H2_POLSC